jgi:hypothetical protein
VLRTETAAKVSVADENRRAAFLARTWQIHLDEELGVAHEHVINFLGRFWHRLPGCKTFYGENLAPRQSELEPANGVNNRP